LNHNCSHNFNGLATSQSMAEKESRFHGQKKT
jgi:hypothetical protein